MKLYLLRNMPWDLAYYHFHQKKMANLFLYSFTLLERKFCFELINGSWAKIPFPLQIDESKSGLVLLHLLLSDLSKICAERIETFCPLSKLFKLYRTTDEVSCCSLSIAHSSIVRRQGQIFEIARRIQHGKKLYGGIE
jgi:hypothetical protein